MHILHYFVLYYYHDIKFQESLQYQTNIVSSYRESHDYFFLTLEFTLIILLQCLIIS